MAKLNCFNDLKEDTPCELIVADVTLLLGNLSEKIAFGAVLHDHVGAVG